MTKDAEKDGVHKVIFVSVFTSKTVLRQFEAHETSGKLWRKE